MHTFPPLCPVESFDMFACLKVSFSIYKLISIMREGWNTKFLDPLLSSFLLGYFKFTSRDAHSFLWSLVLRVKK